MQGMHGTGISLRAKTSGICVCYVLCVCVYKMVMFMHKLKNKSATISKSICEMLNSFSGLEPIGVSL